MAMTKDFRAYVDKLMIDQKLSESQAVVVCSASLNATDQGITFDTSEQFKATIDEDTGFLTAPVTLARTGVQYYYGFEIGLKDRALEKIGVYRSPEQVFHEDSVRSYINLVATDDHPSELVTTDNVKKLQVGSVSNVVPNNKTLAGIVTITDAVEIGKIKSGKIEVSVGYKNKLKPVKGFDNGDAYEFEQTNIVANHLAIVDAGRCGPACKLTIDHTPKEKKTMIKVIIDGISFDVADDALGQAITKQQSAHDEEKKEMEKKHEKEVEDNEEEKKKLKKEKEEANAAKDAALSKVLTDADINALVDKRAELLSTAKAILGDKMPECTDCEKEIKTAVIDHVLDLEIKDWSAKTMDYVNPSYDIAVTQSKKVAKSLKRLGDELNTIVKDDGTKVTRKTSQINYQKDFLGIGKEDD